MNKLFTKIAGAFIVTASLVIVGCSNAASLIKAKPYRIGDPGDSVTWTWTASSSNKLSTTAGANTLIGSDGSSSVSISGTTAVTGGAIQNSYQSSYNGQQMGTGKANMTQFTLTFGNPWGGTGDYKDYTKITSVSLSGSCGNSSSYTVSATIDGTAATNTNSTTTLYAGTGSTNTCIFAPASEHESGVIVLKVVQSSGSQAWYLSSVSVTAEVPEPIGDPTYTVSYDANGGTGTMTDGSSPYASGATVTVLSNTFTRDGYTFNHWDTEAEDGGTDYAAGDTFAISANTTLYAQWTEAPRMVTYNPNGATSGSVPTDATVYDNGASVTIKGNTGSLAKSGYVWAGWNTKADGTGISYVAGATFSISKATTLYARWIADQSNILTRDITAIYLNLPENSSAYTEEKTVVADDGMEYIIAPSADNKVNSYTSSGDKSFDNSSLSKIFIGKAGAYFYNKDSFQRSIEKVEVYASSNCSTNVKIEMELGTTIREDSFDESESAITLSSTNTVYTLFDDEGSNNYTYFRLQVLNAYNAQIQIRITFYNPTESVTVTPESVSLTPTATQQLTTVVSPADTTDSLVYTSSNTDVATVSDSGLITAKTVGNATITATSGSYSDTCTVTVTPNPYITPAKTETSGYTGLNETLSFTYGYLTGSLSVVSSNTSVVTVGDPSMADGSGTVQINFVAAGSTTVKFKDGATEKASVAVTVSTSMVTITGMPVTKTINYGTSFNLGALITVTPSGSCGSDVTWSSSSENVATVNSTGTVTAHTLGSTTITVTPEDYPAGAVSCTITVKKVVVATFAATDSGDGTLVEDSDADLKTEYGYNIDSNIEFSDFAYVYPKTNCALKFGGSSTQGSVKVGLTDGEVNSSKAYITRIVVNAMSYSTDGTKINIAGNSKSLTTSYADYEVSFSGYGTTTVSIQASKADKQRFRIAYIEVYYEFAEATIESSVSTQAMLSYSYNKIDEDTFEFSNVVIRFNGFIDVNLWNNLNGEDDNILGYGFLLTRTNPLDEKSLKQHFAEQYEANSEDFEDTLAEFGKGELSAIKAYYADLAGDPATATDDQKIELGILDDNDYYIWNLRKKVSTSDFTTDFTAVAFIRTKTGVVFLQEKTTSVSQIALDLIDTDHIYSDDAFDGSLEYLAIL